MANLKKEMLTTKPTLVLLALVVAVVISVGYILALAILAPEQLAEATAAATDLVCDKCVGTTDIADNAVTTGKIANGQVKAPDIATDAVTAAEIGSSQVGNSEIADDAVTSAKIGDDQVTTFDISDSLGVISADIADGRVFSIDIGDGQVSNRDIANDAIQPNVQRVEGSITPIAPGSTKSITLDCPAGRILSGGGFGVVVGVQVFASSPLDGDTWEVVARNQNPVNAGFRAYALCIGPSP
jgi:hypothetical protein